jgi:hypothetical protein
MSRHWIGPSARWGEFPRIGHNVSSPAASSGKAFSPRGAKITADFIDNPRGHPIHRVPIAPRLSVFFRNCRHPLRPIHPGNAVSKV